MDRKQHTDIDQLADAQRDHFRSTLAARRWRARRTHPTPGRTHMLRAPEPQTRCVVGTRWVSDLLLDAPLQREASP